MGINDQSVGECKFLPLFNISPKAWLEFISNRHSNFSDNNLFVPNLELSFQGIYNEESDLTCHFMTSKQNEAFQPLRCLMWPLCSCDKGQEGWAGPILPFIHPGEHQSCKKTAHGLAWLLSPKWVPVEGFSRARERKGRRIEMFFWLSASFHTVLKLEGPSSPKPNLKRC